jgi:hypothetical protein
MRTPAGTECRYYYEDFHRGRATRECRLILASRHSLAWQPGLCARCAVPAVLRANGSGDLRLELTVRKRLLLWTRLDLGAYCVRHSLVIEDPYRGCPVCTADQAIDAPGS